MVVERTPSVSKFRVNKTSIIHEILNDEAVVMNLETGLYFAFNDVATTIWSYILLNEYSEDDIIAFAGSQNQSFIDFLLTHEIVSLETSLENYEHNSLKLNSVDKVAEWHVFTDLKDLLLLDPIHDVALNDQGWPSFKNDPN